MPNAENFGFQITNLVTGFVAQLLDLVFGFVAAILTGVANALVSPFG